MEIKKDWLYNYKFLVFGIIGLGCTLGIILLIATLFNTTDNIAFMQTLYESLYGLSITYTPLYFSFCFTAVAPQFGNNKTYLSTTNLPFSRKQLFFKGLKPFLIVFPIYFLFGTFINTFLIYKSQSPIYEVYSFGILFIQSISSLLVRFMYILTICLQMTSAIIFSLSKNIRWYIITPCIILFNGILIGLLILGNCVFNLNLSASLISGSKLSIIFSWFNGNTLIFFIGTLLLFLFAFRNIEKIHR